MKTLLICGAFVAVPFILATKLWILPRFRVESSVHERRRRQSLNVKGRLRDATITELRDHFIFYSYTVAGVEYNASQDVTGLEGMLPSDPVGPANIKYSLQNPADSIVICEAWSGLRGWKGGIPDAS